MIRLTCNNCDENYEFEDTELDYEHVGIDPDRQMGAENEYLGRFDFECDCNNHIIAEFRFWEYPEMVLNNSICNVEGCTVHEEPNYLNYF